MNYCTYNSPYLFFAQPYGISFSLCTTYYWANNSEIPMQLLRVFLYVAPLTVVLFVQILASPASPNTFCFFGFEWLLACLAFTLLYCSLESTFITFADFHGINIPPMANFKLLMWHYWTQSWGKCTVIVNDCSWSQYTRRLRIYDSLFLFEIKCPI